MTCIFNKALNHSAKPFSLWEKGGDEGTTCLQRDVLKIFPHPNPLPTEEGTNMRSLSGGSWSVGSVI